MVLEDVTRVRLAILCLSFAFMGAKLFNHLLGAIVEARAPSP